uniref:Uncharacterized protein n=1 Tax=Methylophaga nitratireducenticrescens TaxID=754476 RepID=I1XI13_METNJ
MAVSGLVYLSYPPLLAEMKDKQAQFTNIHFSFFTLWQ